MRKEKRKKIILVAKELFKQYGLNKTSLTDIAQKVGLNKSTLYYYFKDKYALFSEVLEVEVNNFINHIKEKLSLEKKPKDKLRRYFLERLSYIKNTLDIFKITPKTYYSLKEIIQEKRALFFKREQELLIEILKEGIEKNIFKITDTKFLATAIIGTLRGLDEVMLIEKRQKVTKKDYENLINIFFYGIIKSKPC